MPSNLLVSVDTLFAFLLTLARVSGALVFVPLPGFKTAPEMVKVVLSVSVTFALFGQWPAVHATGLTAGKLLGWAGAETAIGVAIGISAAIVLEAFNIAAQIFGLQAGYAYASTIDPNSQADAGILLVLSQLIAGMLFFAMGLDRDVFRLFAESMAKIPAGSYVPTMASADAMIHLGTTMFTVGIRLALPVVTLLVLVDVSLALLGRLNAQLQLLSLAFPVKMLTSLLVLVWIAPMFPRLLREMNGNAWVWAHRILGF